LVELIIFNRWGMKNIPMAVIQMIGMAEIIEELNFLMILISMF